MRASIVILIFLLVVSASQCADLTGGFDRTISGTSDSKGGGNSNIFDLSSINDRNIRDYRDPDQYITNPFKKPDRSTPISSNSGNESSDSESTSTTNSFTFEMTGDVNGNGSFNDWKAVQNVAGITTKQSSSSLQGNVLHTSRMAIYKDLATNGSGFVASRDTVSFEGKSYLDREAYSNNGDLIQNRFSSGIIQKDSIYFGNYLNSVYTDILNTTARKVMQTQYDLKAQFIGVSSFSALDGNESEIVQDYTGKMVINTSLLNVKRYNLTSAAEGWLPCYNCECAI